MTVLNPNIVGRMIRRFFCWVWGLDPRKLNICNTFWGTIFLPLASLRWRPARILVLSFAVLASIFTALVFILSSIDVEKRTWSTVLLSALFISTAVGYFVLILFDMDEGFRSEGQTRVVGFFESALERLLGYRIAEAATTFIVRALTVVAFPFLLSVLVGLWWDKYGERSKAVLLFRQRAVTFKASFCPPIH